MKKIDYIRIAARHLVKNVVIHFDYEGDLVFRYNEREIVWFFKKGKKIQFWGFRES